MFAHDAATLSIRFPESLNDHRRPVGSALLLMAVALAEGFWDVVKCEREVDEEGLGEEMTAKDGSCLAVS